MSKFLRDNGFALTLACFCLLLSAWLYGADILSQSSVVQLSLENDHPDTLPNINNSLGGPRAPTGVALDNSVRQIPRAKSTTPGQQRLNGIAGLPDFADTDLSPADWQADPSQPQQQHQQQK